MTQASTKLRRILLLLIVVLLASTAYLALQYSTYYEGAFQTVSGQKLQGQNGLKEFDERPPVRNTESNYDLGVLREGRLFFKEVKEEEPVILPTPPTTNQPEPVIIQPQPPVQPPVEPPKPTCPWVVTGILAGEKSKAILVNKQNQTSLTVNVGTKLGDFEVLEIMKNYVIVKSPEAEFKLELGGM